MLGLKKNALCAWTGPWSLAPVRKYKGHPDGRCSTFEAVVALLRTLGHPKNECEALLHNMRVKVDAVLVGLAEGVLFLWSVGVRLFMFLVFFCFACCARNLLENFLKRKEKN